MGAQARQLAFGVAGGLIGGLFTAGTFSATGFAIGSALGAPKQKSKVADLKTQVAETGTVLPDLCGGDISDPLHPGQTLEGGVKLAGVVIDCGPYGGIEKVHHDSGGGGTGGRMFGLGGDGDDQFLDCAIGFCRGDDEHPYFLKTLWADDKKVLDRKATRGQDGYQQLTPIYATIDGQIRLIAEVNDTLGIYYGTSFQDPDPKVALWHPNNRAPAYTFTCYVRISHFDVQPFGHIPTFYGLWQNGVVNRSDQCKFFLARGGCDPSRIDTSAIPGQSRGWVKTQLGGARDIAELVAARSFCRLVEVDGMIRAVDLTNPVSWQLEWSELRCHIVQHAGLSGQGPGGSSGGQTVWPAALGGQITEEINLPSMRHVRFSDVLQGYDENTVTARFDSARHENVTTLDMPTVDDNASMHAWNRAALAADWMMKDGREIFLPPGRIEISPGDEVSVPRGPEADAPREQYLVESLSAGTPGPVTLQLRPFDPGVFQNLVLPLPQEQQVPRNTRIAPYLFAADTSPLADWPDNTSNMMSAPGLWLAYTAPKEYLWEQGYLSPQVPRGSGFRQTDFVTNPYARASIGELAFDYAVVGPTGFSTASAPQVRMFYGAPHGAPLSTVRGGANILVFESGRYLQWCGVSALGTQGTEFEEFVLSNVMDGFANSDYPESAPGGVIPAGTRVLLLTNESGDPVPGATWCQTAWGRIGAFDRVQGQPPRQNGDDLRSVRPLYSGPFQARNLQPPPPNNVRFVTRTDGSATVTGRAATRWARDDAWSNPASSGRLSDQTKYRIVIGGREFVRNDPEGDAAFSFAFFSERPRGTDWATFSERAANRRPRLGPRGDRPRHTSPLKCKPQSTVGRCPATPTATKLSLCATWRAQSKRRFTVSNCACWRLKPRPRRFRARPFPTATELSPTLRGRSTRCWWFCAPRGLSLPKSL